MDNKQIQRQRMMQYFIDAAKEIMKEEGAKGLTARKVGERAGYSYATIYNYFRDFSELLTYCVFDFLEDCYKYMVNFKDDSEDPRNQIIIYAEAYLSYFAKNPDMFHIIFLENLHPIAVDPAVETMSPSVALLLKENLMQCAKRGYIEDADITIVQGLIGHTIHGRLMFYLKDRTAETLDEMILSLRREIEFLLKNRKVSL
jgi:AcrR family transcriptional regulator